MTRLCSEAASFRWSEIMVLKIFTEFPFGFYRHYTTEKQWYRPNGLPRIAYLFKLKGVCPVLGKSRAALRLCRENYGEKYNGKTIKQLKRH